MWQDVEQIEALMAETPRPMHDDTSVLDLSARDECAAFASLDESREGNSLLDVADLAVALRGRLLDPNHAPDDDSSIRMLLRDTDPHFHLRRCGTIDSATDANCAEFEELVELSLAAVRDHQALLNRALQRVDFFRDLSPELRHDVVRKLVLKPFAAGDFLLHQGDRAESLVVLLEGTVKVVVAENERIHNIARLSGRTVIGEIGLVTRAKRTASVVAETAGWAATLSRGDYESLAVGNLLLTASLSELISRRLGKLDVDALCGKVIDRYEIRQRLGRGGMGIVYLAIDRTEQRLVALKMLPHDQALDLSSSRRFRQEAEIVRTLSHPNVVRVFREFSAFGTTFIAMEFCDGPSLSDVIRCTGPLPADVVRRIVGQIAAGLLHTHTAEIAHRDLKPSNVLLTRKGEAKLADFGLARTIAKDQSELTQVGEMMGTPKYMAPEQIDGERGDQRSDLYSMGCIAYELWTGKSIFQAKLWRELLREHARWELPPREKLVPAMDESMYALLSGALIEDPQERKVDLAAIAKWAGPVDLSMVPTAANLFATEASED